MFAGKSAGTSGRPGGIQRNNEDLPREVRVEEFVDEAYGPSKEKPKVIR